MASASFIQVLLRSCSSTPCPIVSAMIAWEIQRLADRGRKGGRKKREERREEKRGKEERRRRRRRRKEEEKRERKEH